MTYLCQNVWNLCHIQVIAKKVTSNPTERTDLVRESYNCEGTVTDGEMETQLEQSYYVLVQNYCLNDGICSSAFQIIFRYFGLGTLFKFF